MTPVWTISASLSKPLVALKYGSYCLTGLPLLLNKVRPVPTQRGSTVPGKPGTSPGSAWTFVNTTRPKPWLLLAVGVAVRPCVLAFLRKAARAGTLNAGRGVSKASRRARRRVRRRGSPHFV